MNKKPSNSKKRKQVQQNTIPSPDPIELAKLAAMLRPDDSPKIAMQKAMEFYLEAVLFAEELPDNFDDLLTWYGSRERKNDRWQREIKEAHREDWEGNALKLEPKKDWDEVRSYLAECAEKEGLKAKEWFQSGNQVLAAIREYQNKRPKKTLTAPLAPSGDQLIERFRRKESDGTTFYLIPRFKLRRVVRLRMDEQMKRASARARKGAATRKQRDQAERRSVQ